MRLVYDYLKYREFLRDYYSDQKDRSPSFSYSVFAKQCGLASSSHIQLILSGKRNLTVHNIHRIIEALALPTGEAEYFETLVHLNQSETNLERNFYRKRLDQLQSHKPQSSARIKISQLLSNAYFPALLLSIENHTVEEAIAEAKRRFGYSVEDIQKLLTQLLTEGVLVSKEGRLTLSHRHLILHDKKTRSQAQKQFLRQQMRLSQQAFEEGYEKDAKFYAHTFTLPFRDYDRYIAEVQNLIERITEMSDMTSGDTVAQLNVQMFPYERKIEP